SSRRRHTRSKRDWSSDVCSSDLSIENLTDLYYLMNARKHSYLVFKVQMKKDLHFLQKMHIIVLVFPYFIQCLVAIAKRSHLFPYRTQQLSSSAPMVVRALPLQER